MVKREIVEINRDLCNGCGLCTNACAEGALKLDNENKAVLVHEIYCDGLGACLDICPTGALKIVKKDSDDYDSNKTYEHVLKTKGEHSAKLVHTSEPNTQMACGCPGSLAKAFAPKADNQETALRKNHSELSQWPIQLQLVSPLAPYFNKCDLLFAADCTAFALGSFHSDLLKGKKLIIACPKLDDTSSYVGKLAELIKNNVVYSITVARMTVPCCSGLSKIAQQAVDISGKQIAIREIIIDMEGGLLEG